MDGCASTLFLVALGLSLGAFLRTLGMDQVRKRLQEIEDDLLALRMRLNEMSDGAQKSPAEQELTAPTPSTDAPPLEEAAAKPTVPLGTPYHSPTRPATPAAPPDAPTPPADTPPPIPVETVTPEKTAGIAIPTPSTPPPASAKPPRAAPEAAARGSQAAPTRKWSDLEELLGTQIFLKAGVAIVVIGVVFFLGYAIKSRGPLGRVVVGSLAAAAMLGVGLYAERLEKYRKIGRALLAGGWGLLYFVTFAMHFLPAARIVDSATVAAVAMFIAAGAAVAFSLRYKSEWTTTATFLLIFLTLLVAATQLDATFNLVATLIVALAISYLAWRLAWKILQSLGALATWIMMAVWLIPHTLARGTAGLEAPVIVSLVLVWAAFQTSILRWRQRGGPDEQWQVGAFIANLLAVGLALFYVLESAPDGDWLVALLFGISYLAIAVAMARQERRELYLLSATVAIILLVAVPPLFFGLESQWLSLFWLAEIELVLVAGVLLPERYFRFLAYLAFALVFIDLMARSSFVPERFRIPLLVGGIAVSLFNTNRLRTRWRSVLADDEQRPAVYLFSIAATILLIVLVWSEMTPLWVAAALAVAALLWALASLKWSLRDFLWESCALGVLSFAGLMGHNFPADPEKLSKTGYSGPILVAALVLYAVYVLFRISADRHPELPADWLRSIATIFSLVGLVALVGVILQTASDPWMAPLLLALMTAHIGLAPRLVWRELLFEGLIVGLLGLWLVVDTSWRLEGELLGLPARLVSVTVCAVFLYVSHFLLRGAGSNPKIDDESFSPLTKAGLGQLAALYLTAPTVIVAWLVKSEALAHDKNLLVALIWGVAGVSYVEVGRLLASRAWFLHGHGLLVAGTVHLFLVNFLQEGYLGPISYRLITVGLFFALLLYIFLTWRGATKRLELPTDADRGRLAYHYALVVVPAFLLLYELPRAWVVVGWAAVALVALFLWRQGGDVHWRYAASGMAIATAVRGIASNLTFRDEILNLRTNLFVVPLTCLVMLVGYEVIRRWELRNLAEESGTTQGRPWQVQTSRLAWLFSLLALLTVFIFVEASGTALTVWLSIEGLAVITLGLQARERFARLFGLLLLSFCVLKIFLYDLRGLTGLPRIFSFVVLGLVLIAVSFGYTRFKERLKELL